MSQFKWEADKMLDVYIYDYLVKRNMQATANSFQAEGNVSSDPVAIDVPGGFLFEWWSVFWDMFIARASGKHSEAAASYMETQLNKAREQQKQPPPPPQHQRREVAQLLTGTPNGLVGSDPFMRQNPGTASAIAMKMYGDQLKLPLQRDSLDDPSIMKLISGENVGQLLVPSNAAMLKPAAISAQPPGQVLHGSARSLSGTSQQQVQTQNQQLPGSVQNVKPDVNQVLSPRIAGPDGSLIGVPGSNLGGNNLTLKGWPLAGIDQFRSGILQQQKSFTQSPQPFHQLQYLSPQQQQQLLLQAQQSLTSSSAGDVDTRSLRMLLSNRNMVLGKDGHTNSVADVIANVGSPMHPAVPRTETEMLIKHKIALLEHQQQESSGQRQQVQQNTISSQQSQNKNHYLHQPDKNGAASITMDGSMSNSSRGIDQVSKNQNERKRKQPLPSSGPVNSSGSANTAGPSPSSAPSTPSTLTPGDVISKPSLQSAGSSSKPFTAFGSDGAGNLTSPSIQLADMDRFVEDGTLDDNVDSFLSPEATDPRDVDESKGFTFTEIGRAQASTSKVACCHFSHDGKLLATGGHDKKVVLWYTDTLKRKSTLEEHSNLITDVRFSPSLSRLATSSFDKTVRVWDADNPDYSLRTFTGHSAAVMSLDFHPSNDDIICSCDGDGEMRYWSINNGSCIRVFNLVQNGTTKMNGSTKMRFQPRLGKYLAAASENKICILDVETQICRHLLQGHTKHVCSVCWDASGDYLASVSEDSVRVWSLRSRSEGECVHHLSCKGNKFHSCTFHPTYPSMLLIGCYESLELWDMTEDKPIAVMAHNGLVSALAVSNVTGLVASASHDMFIKLWK